MMKSNYYNKEEKEKIKISQIIALIIWSIIFLFVLSEFRDLVLFTVGKKQRDETFLYNFIYNSVYENKLLKKDK